MYNMVEILNKVFRAKAEGGGPGSLDISLTSGTSPVSVANPLPVSSDANQSIVTFSRSNSGSAYTAGDVIGPAVTGNLEFANVSSSPGSMVDIFRATLYTNGNVVPSGMDALRLHLYSSAPTIIADDAAFDLAAGDRSKYVGHIDFDTINALGATLFAQASQVNCFACLAPGSTTLYGVLQTISGFTPVASASYTVALYVVTV